MGISEVRSLIGLRQSISKSIELLFSNATASFMQDNFLFFFYCILPLPNELFIFEKRLTLLNMLSVTVINLTWITALVAGLVAIGFFLYYVVRELHYAVYAYR